MSVSGDVEKWEPYMVQPLWKTVWKFFKNLKTDVPDSSVHFEVHTQCILKYYVEETLNSLIIAESFTIANL